MAYADLYRPDRLFLPQQKLAAFAGNVPTPFYIYHAEGIRKAAQLIRGSFCWAPEHRAWFPISANGCPQILRILREEGFGVLARSVRELELAQACGFSDIAFHTGAMTAEAARAAAKAGCTVIFDSPAQIEAMANCLPPRCLLRLCPEKDPGTNRAVAALKNRSGMDRTQILAAVQTLRSRGAEHIGLHCHLPGAPGDERHYPAVAAMLLELALEIYTHTGVRIDCIDPGGGIDVRRFPISIAIGEDRAILADFNASLFMTAEDVKNLYETEISVDIERQIREGIEAHDTSPDAHSGFLKSLNIGVLPRLALAELAEEMDSLVGSVGYRYEKIVTFDTVEGITMTGNWNTSLARVEF